jgi:hypothetical protein
MATLRSRAKFLVTGVVPMYSQLTDSACAICTEHLECDVIQILQCGHFFHCTCILRWFQGNDSGNRTCPNCRTVLYESTPTPLQRPERQREPDVRQAAGTHAEQAHPLAGILGGAPDIDMFEHDFSRLHENFIRRHHPQSRAVFDRLDTLSRLDMLETLHRVGHWESQLRTE